MHLAELPLVSQEGDSSKHGADSKEHLLVTHKVVVDQLEVNSRVKVVEDHILFMGLLGLRKSFANSLRVLKEIFALALENRGLISEE